MPSDALFDKDSREQEAEIRSGRRNPTDLLRESIAKEWNYDPSNYIRDEWGDYSTSEVDNEFKMTTYDRDPWMGFSMTRILLENGAFISGAGEDARWRNGQMRIFEQKEEFIRKALMSTITKELPEADLEGAVALSVHLVGIDGLLKSYTGREMQALRENYTEANLGSLVYKLNILERAAVLGGILPRRPGQEPNQRLDELARAQILRPLAAEKQGLTRFQRSASPSPRGIEFLLD